VAELDGLEPEELEELGPEEPPAEVDIVGRPEAHDRCSPQSGPCRSGIALAVCTVVEEELWKRRCKTEIVVLIPHVLALHRSVVPILHCLLVPSWMQRGRRGTGQACHAWGRRWRCQCCSFVFLSRVAEALIPEIAKEDTDQTAKGKEDFAQCTGKI
jgi:hypothetical protein